MTRRTKQLLTACGLSVAGLFLATCIAVDQVLRSVLPPGPTR